MRLVLVLSLLASAALALPIHADTPAVLDSGSYRIYRQGQAVGSESFAFEARGDSIVVTSYVLQTLPGSPGPDTLRKTMALVAKAEDYDLLGY